MICKQEVNQLKGLDMQEADKNSWPITIELFGNYFAWVKPQQEQAAIFGFTPDVNGLAHLIDNYLMNGYHSDLIANHAELVHDYSQEKIARFIPMTDKQQKALEENNIDKTALLAWVSGQCYCYKGMYSLDPDDDREASHFNSAVFC